MHTPKRTMYNNTDEVTAITKQILESNKQPYRDLHHFFNHFPNLPYKTFKCVMRLYDLLGYPFPKASLNKDFVLFLSHFHSTSFLIGQQIYSLNRFPKDKEDIFIQSDYLLRLSELKQRNDFIVKQHKDFIFKELFQGKDPFPKESVRNNDSVSKESAQDNNSASEESARISLNSDICTILDYLENKFLKYLYQLSQEPATNFSGELILSLVNKYDSCYFDNKLPLFKGSLSQPDILATFDIFKKDMEVTHISSTKVRNLYDFFIEDIKNWGISYQSKQHLKSERIYLLNLINPPGELGIYNDKNGFKTITPCILPIYIHYTHAPLTDGTPPSDIFEFLYLLSNKNLDDLLKLSGLFRYALNINCQSESMFFISSNDIENAIHLFHNIFPRAAGLASTVNLTKETLWLNYMGYSDISPKDEDINPQKKEKKISETNNLFDENKKEDLDAQRFDRIYYKKLKPTIKEYPYNYIAPLHSPILFSVQNQKSFKRLRKIINGEKIETTYENKNKISFKNRLPVIIFCDAGSEHSTLKDLSLGQHANFYSLTKETLIQLNEFSLELRNIYWIQNFMLLLNQLPETDKNKVIPPTLSPLDDFFKNFCTLTLQKGDKIYYQDLINFYDQYCLATGNNFPLNRNQIRDMVFQYYGYTVTKPPTDRGRTKNDNYKQTWDQLYYGSINPGRGKKTCYLGIKFESQKFTSFIERQKKSIKNSPQNEISFDDFKEYLNNKIQEISELPWGKQLLDDRD